MSDRYEHKESQGSLFSNAENKKTEKYPDYTGGCVINGVKLNISAWINEAKTSGKKYMSLKFDEYKKNESSVSSTDAPEFSKAEEEIPF